MLDIQQVSPEQFDEIWPIFKEAIRAGDTYVFPPETTKEEGRALWCAPGYNVYIAYLDSKPVATSYIRPNNPGLGDHVSNTGVIVGGKCRGKGVGKQMMQFAVEESKRLGYKAMQLNFVVSTNTASIAMCKAVGFEIIGTASNVFRHAEKGLVDAHIMYRSLEE